MKRPRKVDRWIVVGQNKRGKIIFYQRTTDDPVLFKAEVVAKTGDKFLCMYRVRDVLDVVDF